MYGRCVYTLGHQPNSRVLNNYCHDVQSYNYGGWAYYTDEGSRGLLFESNVAYRTKCAGHHQHYGTDNVLRNNLYYEVRPYRPLTCTSWHHPCP